MKTIRSLHSLEIVITSIQALILLFFGVVQFVPQFRYCLKVFFNTILAVSVPGIGSDTAGIFLQVDAVLALTISLVAIMSGLLSDSHMGISFSDYYLNPESVNFVTNCFLNTAYFGVCCLFL